MTTRESVPVAAIRRQFGSHVREVRSRLAFSYGLGILSVVATLFLPWPLKWLIDVVLPGQTIPGAIGELFSNWPQSAWIMVVAAVFFLASVFARGTSALQRLVDAGTREKLALVIRTEMVEHLTKLSPQLASEHRSGELVTRVVSDANLFVRLVTKTLPLLFRHATTILLALMAMFWLAPELGGFGSLVVPILALISRQFARPLSDAARAKRHAEGELGGISLEVVRGFAALQASGESSGAITRFTKTARAALAAGMTETRIGLAMESTLQITQAAIVAAVMGGGAMLVQSERITLGALTVFVSYIVQLLKPIEKVNELATALARGLAAGERLLEIRARPALVAEPADPIELTHVIGRMELRDVYYRHPDQRGSGVWVLEGASMSLEPGQFTVVTGASGAGKSTLIHLLARLFDPDRGVVLLDGHALKSLSLVGLRNHLTALSQRGHLFAGTVREAISGASGLIEDAAAWDALAQVELVDGVRRLPKGLDSRLGEDGANLSGGERRRLDLARTIAADRKILLLDEPTTGIDEESLSIIVARLRALALERTVLVVSHQPAVLDLADRLWELADGQLHLLRDRATPDLAAWQGVH